MKRRIGISLYPNHSDLKKDLEYIDKVATLGYERVFMSMLELGDDYEEILDKFKTTIMACRNKGLEVMLDVAPDIFEKLGVDFDDLSLFAKLGAHGLRLDAGSNGQKEAMISFNQDGLIIELNMSNDVAYLDNILTYKANKPFLYGCHNFYPQNDTGLDYDFFIKCSERFKKEGIKTAAFVSSLVGDVGPWSVNDGLPTLEMHRKMPLYIQAKHLFATGLIDDVIIGNAYASDEELEALANINRYQLEFEVEINSNNNEVENEIMFKEQHFRRGDVTANMIRSTEVRKKYINVDNKEHDHLETLSKGDIVIGNNGFGKYKNELQVVLKPHANDLKNKVGRVIAEEVFLLDYVDAWTKFKLTRG